jgi:hypothetical protein
MTALRARWRLFRLVGAGRWRSAWMMGGVL